MRLHKTFRNALKTLAAAPLLAGAVTAQAALIDIHYSGSISSVRGDGAGYSIGDLISGTLRIDTSLLPADERPGQSNIGAYVQRNGGPDFVSGFLSNDTDDFDQLYFYDDYSGGLDYFSVIDRSYSVTRLGNGIQIDDSYLNLWAYDYSADFLQGITADQMFSLASGDVQYLGGIIYDYSYDSRTRQRDYGYARMTLNELSYGVAKVPAPDQLALMGLGLLGLLATRRRRNAS